MSSQICTITIQVRNRELEARVYVGTVEEVATSASPTIVRKVIELVNDYFSMNTAESIKANLQSRIAALEAESDAKLAELLERREFRAAIEEVLGGASD